MHKRLRIYNSIINHSHNYFYFHFFLDFALFTKTHNRITSNSRSLCVFSFSPLMPSTDFTNLKYEIGVRKVRSTFRLRREVLWMGNSNNRIYTYNNRFCCCSSVFFYRKEYISTWNSHFPAHWNGVCVCVCVRVISRDHKNRSASYVIFSFFFFLSLSNRLSFHKKPMSRLNFWVYNSFTFNNKIKCKIVSHLAFGYSSKICHPKSIF